MRSKKKNNTTTSSTRNNNKIPFGATRRGAARHNGIRCPACRQFIKLRLRGGVFAALVCGHKSHYKRFKRPFFATVVTCDLCDTLNPSVSWDEETLRTLEVRSNVGRYMVEKAVSLQETFSRRVAGVKKKSANAENKAPKISDRTALKPRVRYTY